MKYATWNVNSLKIRLPQVLNWLATHTVDVLCLQELKLEDHAFPLSAVESAGYHAVYYGQKTYNGVAILTRKPLKAQDLLKGMPNFADQQCRVISATVGDRRVICVYVVNGAALDSDKYHYKLAWLTAFNHYLSAEIKRYQGQVIVLGDFNIAPSDLDVYDPIAWKEQILCSSAERAHFSALLDLGFYDAFRLLHPNAQQYSWWDYRAAMFRRKLGLRIDHILIDHAIKPSVQHCEIDSEPRTWERPSDHAPVILTLS